jgi:hypothetical protein
MKKMILAIITAVTACMFLTGCGDSDIARVKAGTMNAYPDVTLEKVLESKFTNIKWSTFEKGGRKYVRFDGKINPQMHIAGCKNTGGLLRTNQDYKKQYSEFYSKVIQPMKRKYEYATGETRKQYFDKRTKLEDKFTWDYLNKHAWKVGSDFAIEWVIHPNSENFEMTGITVDGLIPGQRLDPDAVFECIFAK